MREKENSVKSFQKYSIAIGMLLVGPMVWAEQATDSLAPSPWEISSVEAETNATNSPGRDDQSQGPANQDSEEAEADDQPRFSESELERARLLIERRQLTAKLLLAFRYENDQTIAALLAQLADVGPDSEEYHYFTALSHYREGEKGRALLDLESALDANPRYGRAWNLKGLILSEADRHSEALECFAAAIDSSPYNPTYVYNRASALYRIGENDRALEAAIRATHLKANLSEAHYLAALILRNRSDYRAARDSFYLARKYGQSSTRFLVEYLLVAEKAEAERDVLELCDVLEKDDDTEVLRHVVRIRIHYGEYTHALLPVVRIVNSNEAKPEDRENYVFILFKLERADIARRIAALNATSEEKEDLVKYWQILRSERNETIETRDPIVNPIR